MKIKLLFLCSLFLLSGCATTLLENDEGISIPRQYETKQESNNKEVVDLKNWWKQFNDNELLSLIEFAQEKSPSISAAVVNIKAYEAAVVGVNSRSLPNLSLSGGGNVGVVQPSTEKTSSSQMGLQTSWELDLFGKNELQSLAQERKLKGAEALWYGAKTVVAAQMAKSYFNYRFCARTLSILEEDYKAREKQDNITKLNVGVGLESRSSLYLSNANLARERMAILNKGIECEAEIKGLTALTGLNESDLRDLLKKETADKIDLFVPVSVPGALIAQRPDIFNALQELESENFALGSVRAEKYPSISISGNISATSITSGGISSNGMTWAVGPINITFPIFDGGRQKANENLSLAQYEHAKLNFAHTFRHGVKEVEIALLYLNQAKTKKDFSVLSSADFEKALNSTTEKYKAGLASLFELEGIRLSYLNAKRNEIMVEQELIYHWIDLYKAVGGGFKYESKNEK